VRWTLILPSDRIGLAEPLVTAGVTGRGDFLFVRYVDSHRIAFGVDHWGGGASISPPIEVDYGRPHEVVALLGSLVPPPAGAADGLPPEFRRWRNQALVLLDGQVVFHWMQPWWPARPSEIRFGVNLIGGTAAEGSFSGEVLKLDAAPLDLVRRFAAGPVRGSLMEDSWMRAAPAASAPPASAGPRPGLAQWSRPGRTERLAGVHFRLTPGSPAQPLLSFARVDGAWGLLAIGQSEAGLKFGWLDSEGWAWSQPLSGTAGGDHTVAVQWNAALDAPGAATRLAAAFITVDGMIHGHPRPRFFDLPLAEVSAWHAPAPVPAGVARDFSGSILRAPVLPALALERTGAPGARRFRLAVQFAADRPGRSEPLVTAGRTGTADGLFVRYERPGWVRIGFDHWGKGGPLSPAVPAAVGAYHLVEVEMGAGSWTDPRGRRIRVSLDGRPVLNEPGEFFPVAPADVVIGRNPIGLSTSDPGFTGDIFGIEEPGPAP